MTQSLLTSIVMTINPTVIAVNPTIMRMHWMFLFPFWMHLFYPQWIPLDHQVTVFWMVKCRTESQRCHIAVEAGENPSNDCWSCISNYFSMVTKTKKHHWFSHHFPVISTMNHQFPWFFLVKLPQLGAAPCDSARPSRCLAAVAGPELGGGGEGLLCWLFG